MVLLGLQVGFQIQPHAAWSRRLCRRGKAGLWPRRTKRPLRSRSCVVRLWAKAGSAHDWLQCPPLDGWQSEGSEVHCCLSSVTAFGPASKDSKEEFDEEDSEASRHLGALPSTSWGQAGPLGGSRRRENKVHTVMQTQTREWEGGGSGCSFGRFLLQRSSLWGRGGWRKDGVGQ